MDEKIKQVLLEEIALLRKNVKTIMDYRIRVVPMELLKACEIYIDDNPEDFKKKLLYVINENYIDERFPLDLELIKKYVEESIGDPRIRAVPEAIISIVETCPSTQECIIKSLSLIAEDYFEDKEYKRKLREKIGKIIEATQAPIQPVPPPTPAPTPPIKVPIPTKPPEVRELEEPRELPSIPPEIKNEIIQHAISSAEEGIHSDEYAQELKRMLKVLQEKGFSGDELTDLSGFAFRTFLKNKDLVKELKKAQHYQNELLSIVREIHRLASEGKSFQKELQEAIRLQEVADYFIQGIKININA